MVAEVWFRNPDLYIRECVELDVSHIAWDRGYLVKKSIDPVRFADLYYPAHIDYRLLLVGDQGTAELRRGTSLDRPVAVYPTWDYEHDDIGHLEEMLLRPQNDEVAVRASAHLPADECPVLGQEHRVVMIRIPPANTGPGRKFLNVARDLQQEYPDALLHPHGTYSWRIAFGLGFRSVDIEPRLVAKKGKVVLPSGKEVTYERAAMTPQWVTLLGYKPVELSVPRNRCMYNMKSALWAAEHYLENFRFRVVGSTPVDPDSPEHVPEQTNAYKTRSTPATVDDKLLCDLCSLQHTCKYFRCGGVCSIPGSEPARLASFFKTRDADAIIEGLGTLLATQTRRLERSLGEEAEMGGPNGPLDPEVTKLINSLFEQGTRLAKLLAPARFSPGAKIAVNVSGGGAALVTGSQPSSLVAGVVAELEARGISRDRITPEMIEGLLSPSGAIEARVLSTTTSIDVEGHESDDE